MRTLATLLIGILVGSLLTLGIATMSGGWYEYRIALRDNPIDMVNADGWELVGYPQRDTDRNLWYLRRPRLRWH